MVKLAENKWAVPIGASLDWSKGSDDASQAMGWRRTMSAHSPLSKLMATEKRYDKVGGWQKEVRQLVDPLARFMDLVRGC